jgi:predicted AAA+ superfamily ATPase
MIDFKDILGEFNPWWKQGEQAFPALPEFRRPVFAELCEDLENLPQMLSVTGPRRVGKSTLLRQMIRHLIKKGTAPEKLIYYSFDDPALEAKHIDVDRMIDLLMKHTVQNKASGPTYLFLDEIQRLERWELYLKKYYDLRYPVKILISGSASSPIFKKSRESLLGRVKDYHVLPFSFREFVLYSWRENTELTAELNAFSEAGQRVRAIVNEDPHQPLTNTTIPRPSPRLKEEISSLLQQYFLEGGFPEVWTLPTWVAKQDYLYNNQVKKVIYEDLVLAVEFRKPELLNRFYISLLERPGAELAVKKISNETEINAQQIEKYMPLLEMTDLVYKVTKFRAGPLRLRKGLMKFYLADLALRNAALRLTDTLLTDDTALGLYAENLVFLALRKWRGAIQMDYYREKVNRSTHEVDFIVHVGPHRYLPVEVKYRNDAGTSDLPGVRRFVEQYPRSSPPIIVTKLWEDVGQRNKMFFLPLPTFLILFD